MTADASAREGLQVLNYSVEERTARIRRGEESAEAWTMECLGRCKARADLCAVTQLDNDRALLQARSIDRRLQAGEDPGPMAGMPYLAKDNIDTVGFATTAGSAVFRNNFPQSDARLIADLAGHGAVLLGKANMHELAMGGTTSNPTFGICRNPNDVRFVPGGSSGGSGAAVSAGLAPLALGSDTAGSVRIPAAFCGVAGLRPATRSYVEKDYPDAGLLPCSNDLDTIGPIARTVADLDFIDRVLTNRSVSAPPDPRELSIGIPGAYFCDFLEAPVAKTFETNLRRLESAGIRIRAVDLTAIVETAVPQFHTLLAAGLCEDFVRFLNSGSYPTLEQVRAQLRGADVKAVLYMVLSEPPTREAVQLAREGRARLQRDLAELMSIEKLDCLAWPTSPILPPAIQELGDRADPRIVIDDVDFSLNWTMVRNTIIGSSLGAPSLSVPAGRSANGLPIGMELLGPLGQTGRLLAIGGLVESILGAV